MQYEIQDHLRNLYVGKINIVNRKILIELDLIKKKQFFTENLTGDWKVAKGHRTYKTSSGIVGK